MKTNLLKKVQRLPISVLQNLVFCKAVKLGNCMFDTGRESLWKSIEDEQRANSRRNEIYPNETLRKTKFTKQQCLLYQNSPHDEGAAASQWSRGQKNLRHAAVRL